MTVLNRIWNTLEANPTLTAAQVATQLGKSPSHIHTACNNYGGAPFREIKATVQSRMETAQ